MIINKGVTNYYPDVFGKFYLNILRTGNKHIFSKIENK